MGYKNFAPFIFAKGAFVSKSAQRGTKANNWLPTALQIAKVYVSFVSPLQLNAPSMR